jgi:protein-disulfide isomerase
MDKIITKKDERELRKRRRQLRSKIKRIFWVLVGVVIVGGLIWFSISESEKMEKATHNLTTVLSDDYTRGAENAPVTLMEYLDFECEACSAYSPLIKQLEQGFPDTLRVVSRYFPLPGHKNGLPAALAVEAAARQDKYNEMHDLLLIEQVSWGEKQITNPAMFEDYAQQLGLDMEQFRKDANSQEALDRVQRDVNSGTELGITGTPTFFLNGKKIKNPQSYEAFQKLITDELGKVEKQKSATEKSQ